MAARFRSGGEVAMTFRSRIPVLPVALAVLALAPAATAGEADSASPDERRWLMSLGAMAVDFDTVMRLDSEAVPGDGTEIRFEDDLGLDPEQTNVRFEGTWRFGKRHRLDFDWLRFSRGNEYVIEKDIAWGDVVFAADGEVKTRFRSNIVGAYYGWSFVRKPRFESGLTAGLSTHIQSTRVEGEGTVYIDGEPQAEEAVSESESITAPIPVFGLYASGRLGENWYLSGSARYFAITIGEHEGSFRDFIAEIDWYPWEKFGFGAGYNWNRMEYKHETDVDTIDVEYDYSGVTVYALFAWGKRVPFPG